jgi:transposase
MPKTPPYSKEFRREAVQLLRTGDRTVPQLAKELGVSQGSLRNWASQRDVDEGKIEGLNSDERDELRRLRRENKVLAEEREILKKPRPSSPRRARPGEGLRVRAREEGRTLDRSDVSRARGLPFGISRLGRAATIAARRAGRSLDNPDP